MMENKKSFMLDEEENSIIFSLLGRKCLTLSTAVVQLLVTLPPQHIKWNHKCTGVVCFVKDNPKRSYFIRVYDIEKREIVWEQELYSTFEYKEQRSFFHTFEADNCMAGLNFSNENEARHFADTVKGKLQNRLARRHDKKPNHNAMQPNIQPTERGLIMPAKPIETKSSSKENRKQGKKKVTKEDIGMPTNFQHIHHIGWNSQTNHFEANKEIFNDTNLLTFLQSAGVTQDQLQDKNTVKFIYDFLDQHGGRDKALAEIENPPPPPQMPPVAYPTYNHSKSNGSHLHKPAQGGLPPPPVMIPPQAQQKPAAPSIPAAPSSANALPPVSSGSNDGHSALMEAIRKGSTLNHVEPTDTSSNSSGGGGGEDIRDQLMNQIRQGVGLRKVEPNANKAEVSKTPTSGLAGALARALQERSRAINQTDDSSDSDSHSSDDEWD
ncbi:PREDICTED: neural Wiskott-Aldrich syndrome protein-like [Rhagoletis zephyria]|uniref:neural Wiskott-Aldrich syndrome protein-like n=1 Tax=Rhagoletis zephyria TaxID=28612 RepID=UPI0008117EB3|nr:PREDICTED: neural Wiskott-Aldrich syndrome protein-like [Rhagoletis zephyria]